jgi:hypothetical protein
MSTLPGGKPVTGKIPDKPQASPRPSSGKPYASAKAQVDNYASRTKEMAAHRESLSNPRSGR